jgi:hypothetical protein
VATTTNPSPSSGSKPAEPTLSQALTQLVLSVDWVLREASRLHGWEGCRAKHVSGTAIDSLARDQKTLRETISRIGARVAKDEAQAKRQAKGAERTGPDGSGQV